MNITVNSVRKIAVGVESWSQAALPFFVDSGYRKRNTGAAAVLLKKRATVSSGHCLKNKIQVINLELALDLGEIYAPSRNAT